MIIITIRTEKPEAEIGLMEAGNQLAYVKWQAHRMLAETIHQKIKQILDDSNNRFENLEGIILYKGPGSFTGLRIGAAVANTLASQLDIAIAGETGDDWVEKGEKRLINGENEKIISPDYGAPARTTPQKK